MRESIVNAIVCLRASGYGTGEIAFRLKLNHSLVSQVVQSKADRIAKWKRVIDANAARIARRLGR